MDDGGRRVHPYIPNAIPDVRAAMLAAIGATSVEELYADIPESLRLRRPLDLPAALGPRRSWSATSRSCSAGTPRRAKP